MRLKFRLGLIVFAGIFLTTIASASAYHTSRTDALNTLSDLLANGAQSKHPEDFKLLINTYFSGVKSLQDKKFKLAEGYFSLVVKYGKTLKPYFTNEAHPKNTDGTESGPTKATRPEIDLPSPTPPRADIKPDSVPEDTSKTGSVERNTIKPGSVRPVYGKADTSPAPQRPAVKKDTAPDNDLKTHIAEKIIVKSVPDQLSTGKNDAMGPLVAGKKPSTGADPIKPVAGPTDNQADDSILGGDLIYKVSKNDTLQTISVKFRTNPKLIARLNNLTQKTKLHKGQSLKIVDRHIVPQKITSGILVNIPDRTLYYFKDNKLVSALPVALGKMKTSDTRSWQTPLGSFKITEKIKDPTWHIPASIQKEMEDQGLESESEIPPGPDNPLGKYAMRTSLPGILIHGTNVPSSIYSYSSHGCIRLAPTSIESIFNYVKINTSGEIIYQPVKIAAGHDGKIYLEVHKDVYGKIKDLKKAAYDTIKKMRLESSIDWSKVDSIIKDEAGFAEEISL